jgi:glycosyltransferase involved in cell wall biosynthesis
MNHGQVSAVVAPSRIVADALKDLGVVCPIVVIGNIIDATLSDHTTGFKVHLWSRNVPWKRHDEFYSVIEATPSIRAIICADSYRGPPLINVEYRSLVPEPWRLAELGDLVVSMARQEAFGRDVFDGLARGCLVACWPGSAVAEYVRDFGAGTVFDSDASIDGIAGVLERWSRIDEHERAARSSVAAHAVRSEFSERSIAGQWTDLIQSISGGS